MVQELVWRKDASCQCERPEWERRDVGCQSEAAESRDAALQVDIGPNGVGEAPCQCPSIKLDEPRLPLLPFYPLYTPPFLPIMPQFRAASPDLHQLHLAMSLSGMPLFQPPLLLAQGASPLPQYFPLPTIPLGNPSPVTGGMCEPSPQPNPADSFVPPGLIAPLSPRLAEDEEEGEEEEGSLLKHKKSVRGEKPSTVRQKKKKNATRCRATSAPLANKRIKPRGIDTLGWKEEPSRTTDRNSGSQGENLPLHRLQDILHPEEKSNVTDQKKRKRLLRQQESEMLILMKEKGGGVKRAKIKMQAAKQVVRPKRCAVAPPIRYRIDSEDGPCGLSADDQIAETAKRKKGEEESEGMMEEMERSRANSAEDGEMEGWCEPCQVCGLQFLKVASLLLHLSVHRTGRWFKCHLCSKKFRLAQTLYQHHHQHHRGNSYRGGPVKSMVVPSESNEFKTSGDEERTEREDGRKEGEKRNEKLLLPPPTKVPDGLTRINRVRRSPCWWVDFQSLTKRRLDNIEWRRRLQKKDGGRGGKEKKMKGRNQVEVKEEKESEWEKRRDEEKDVEEVKAACATTEDGQAGEGRGGVKNEEVKLVFVLEVGGGQEGEVSHGVKNKEVQRVIVMDEGGEHGEGRDGVKNEEVQRVIVMDEGGEHGEDRDGVKNEEVQRVIVMDEGGEHGEDRDGVKNEEVQRVIVMDEGAVEDIELKAVCTRRMAGGEEGERRVEGENKGEVEQVFSMDEGGGQEAESRDARENKEVVSLVFGIGDGGGQEGERAADDEIMEVKTVSVTREKDGGENKVKRVDPSDKGGGKEEKNQGHCGEENEDVRHFEVKKVVMEQTRRPRRNMVGPPIRYLLESEEQSHCLVTSNQDRLNQRKKTQKKNEAGDTASGGTTLTDWWTSQDQADRPRLKKGRTKKVVIDSQAKGGASERQTGHFVSETLKVSDRQMGLFVLDRHGHVVSERPTDPLVTERQTCPLMSQGQTDHLALDAKMMSSILDTQETGDTLWKRQTDRQTHLVYRDLQSGQVTFILPCSVRLQRLL